MRTIPLHGKNAAGRVALVDDADYELVMAHAWHVYEHAYENRPRRNNGPYAHANIRQPGGGWIKVRMHRLITGWPRTDHVNHDGLDNQRANLRPATRSQNGANQRPKTGYTSRYKGVYWPSAGPKWQAAIRVNGRPRKLGSFMVEEDAARAYDAAALAAWGE